MHIVIESVPFGELKGANHAPRLKSQKMKAPTKVGHVKGQVNVTHARLAVIDPREYEFGDLRDSGKASLAQCSLLRRQASPELFHVMIIGHEEHKLCERSADVNAEEVADIKELLENCAPPSTEEPQRGIRETWLYTRTVSMPYLQDDDGDSTHGGGHDEIKNVHYTFRIRAGETHRKFNITYQ